MNEELIISDSCIGCGRCTQVCIRGHIQMGDDKRPHEIESRYSCFRCGHCLAVCPKGAIAFRDLPDFLPSDTGNAPVSREQLSELYKYRRSMRWFDRKCTQSEISDILESARSSPTAENSQAVEYAVIDERFSEFMKMCASILRDHTEEHPRLKQFVDYVESGMNDKNNPFTWEGRQLIIAFARFPIDAIIAMEQIDLMAFTMGLGGFHSRWILQAAENDPERFMSFFPEVSSGLNAYAVYIIGHPRIRFRRTVPRVSRKIIWY